MIHEPYKFLVQDLTYLSYILHTSQRLWSIQCDGSRATGDEEGSSSESSTSSSQSDSSRGKWYIEGLMGKKNRTDLVIFVGSWQEFKSAALPSYKCLELGVEDWPGQSAHSGGKMPESMDSWSSTSWQFQCHMLQYVLLFCTNRASFLVRCWSFIRQSCSIGPAICPTSLLEHS